MNRVELSSRIRDWLQLREHEAIDLVRELVRIPSVNHPPNGNEAACQLFFAEWLKGEGAEVRMYDLAEVPGLTDHPAYMAGRNYEGRPNISAAFRGEGKGRSLLFSGHMDTVYEGTEPWTDGPFEGTVRDGKLFGRGAYDMKGGLAAACMAVRCLRELDVRLAGDVYIESVVDEEHGGANGTLAARLSGLAPADMAVVPEPTNLAVCPAHLGGGIWKASFEGRSGIAFAGEELVSALEATIQFAHLLKAFERHLNALVSPPRWWAHGRSLGVSLLSIVSGDTTRELQEKVPATGELKFWIEGYPGMTGEGILEELWRFFDAEAHRYPPLAACRPVIVPLIRYLSASEMPPGEATEQFLASVKRAGERAGQEQTEPMRGTPFACDGFLFNLHSGTPALILGPSGANAHAADEYLDLPSYMRLIGWYAELMLDWCGLAGEEASHDDSSGD
ncbi:putative metallohydrolase YodQ [Paenibacillus sp. J31TS4]|uniref:M20 family metallopeptidase n=1 Tax=Paenibacillus sp. J31TS4 TaxID=2807195 RepID=UPI001B2C5D61|nr:M20/M25/M40 family metallo-hydrolase [Paenibacillus sp. J31TS4]GIP37231.1 putative metallohydrolase YodQ [Paenibacillus sp. J31TS4]